MSPTVTLCGGHITCKFQRSRASARDHRAMHVGADKRSSLPLSSPPLLLVLHHRRLKRLPRRSLPATAR
eukprot:451183-Rhodomonas_salina.2